MLFFVKKNILRDFLFSELKTLEEFHVCHNPCSRLRGEERVARGILPFFLFSLPCSCLFFISPPLSTSSLLTLVAVCIQFSGLFDCWRGSLTIVFCLHLLFLHMLAILGDSVHI